MNNEMLYEKVIDNEFLTIEDLNECSLNINELIDNKILTKVSNKEYKFLDAEGLYDYGQKLINNKQFDKADRCFISCLKITPKHVGAAFKLFLTNIRKENFEEAFKYFDIFYSNETRNNNNNNLYLYLFSFIIDLPDKYKNWVNNMVEEDVMIKGDSDQYEKTNKIRKIILNNKFLLSLTYLNELINQQSTVFISNYITKKLLIKTIDLEQITKKNILILLETKDYQYIIDMLEEKNNLSVMEKYILKLCNIYIGIEKNGEIPVTNLDSTQNFFVAIDRNNFELASQLNFEHSNNSSAKAISIILNDIINSITKKQIFTSLEELDIDKSFEKLSQYLTKIGKSDYKEGIRNIIRLCFVNHDDSFEKLKEVFRIIDNKTVDIEYYVEKIHNLLNMKDFEQAKFYIKIISNLNVDNKLIRQLNKELNQTKKTSNNKEPEQGLKTKSGSIKNDVESNPYYQFLLDISKRIEKEKLILVYDMDKIQNIEKYVKNFPNIYSFRIEYNGSIIIVLKHHQNDRKDFKMLIREGQDAFGNLDYKKTIECFELINSISDKNVAFCYSKLAWAYFKLGKFNMSLRYFIVTDYLNEKENKKKDYKAMIEKLYSIVGEDEFYKPYFEMDIEELKNEFDDNYNIEVLQEIVNLINTNSISINEACLKFNLNEVQVNIVKLIIVRDCYSQSDYITGDKLLKVVEKSNYKNKTVIDLLNEIRTNRLFYKNREDKQSLIFNSRVLKY